jgi:hypothetical protein
MKARYSLNTPDNVDATLTITMRLSQWKELADQQGENWPSWEFRHKISAMIREANAEYTATDVSIA